MLGIMRLSRDMLAMTLLPFLALEANADCPCKDVSAALKNSAQFNGINLTCSGDCLMEFPGIREGSLFPLTYGSFECKAHDASVGMCNDTVECGPTWCHQKWCRSSSRLIVRGHRRDHVCGRCYVDIDNCDEPDVASSALWTTKNGEKLHYSYDACGGNAAAWEQFSSTGCFYDWISNDVIRTAGSVGIIGICMRLDRCID